MVVDDRIQARCAKCNRMTDQDTQSTAARELITQPVFSCDLPPQMARILELIGWDATLRLINRYGGCYILPTRCARRNDSGSGNAQLVLLIGENAYNKLAAEYDGTRVYCAKCDDAMRKIRNMEISRRYVAGESAATLAIEYRLSERQIWFILKDQATLRVDQPDLFG